MPLLFNPLVSVVDQKSNRRKFPIRCYDHPSYTPLRHHHGHRGERGGKTPPDGRGARRPTPNSHQSPFSRNACWRWRWGALTKGKRRVPVFLFRSRRRRKDPDNKNFVADRETSGRHFYGGSGKRDCDAGGACFGSRGRGAGRCCGWGKKRRAGGGVDRGSLVVGRPKGIEIFILCFECWVASRAVSGEWGTEGFPEHFVTLRQRDEKWYP